MPRIKRITAYPLHVPVAKEVVNCPAFYDQMLHRGDPANKWESNTSQFFGDVPIFAIKVEGDNGGPDGWSDSSRTADPDAFVNDAKRFIGMKLEDIDPRRDMVDVSATDAKAREVNHQVCHPHKCLESAALDFKAMQLDVPLWKLFGDKVRDQLRVEYWSAFRTPEGAAEIAKRARERGFIGLKLKANLDVDVAGVTRAVFDAAGEDFHLNIDPNGRWENVDNSVPRAKAMLDVSPNVLLEDPIYGDYEALAEVRRRTGIPMGITAQWPDYVRMFKQIGAADSINVGGTWHQIINTAAAAAEVGYPVWIGSGLDTGMTDLMSIHLGCTLPNCTIGSDLIGHLFRADDLLVDPIETKGGFAQLPDGPGRGIAPDLDAIERLRIGDPIVVE